MLFLGKEKVTSTIKVDSNNKPEGLGTLIVGVLSYFWSWRAAATILYSVASLPSIPALRNALSAFSPVNLSLPRRISIAIVEGFATGALFAPRLALRPILVE